MVAAKPAAIVVPKVNSADEVRELDAAITAASGADDLALWAMIETPEAIRNVASIATASERLTVLVMGTNDLVAELHAVHVPGRAPILTALSLSVLAARDAGKVILMASTTTSRTPRDLKPNVCRVASSDSTARP